MKPWSNDEYELHCPSVDVCAWCGDMECNGIGCIASLNPDDEADRDAINTLHAEIRRGRLLMQLERRLALAENRL
jgi:hypothetical protein